MRISDWSSDVCSSDLLRADDRLVADRAARGRQFAAAGFQRVSGGGVDAHRLGADAADDAGCDEQVEDGADGEAADQADRHFALGILGFLGRGRYRVEADIGEEARSSSEKRRLVEECVSTGGSRGLHDLIKKKKN